MVYKGTDCINRNSITQHAAGMSEVSSTGVGSCLLTTAKILTVMLGLKSNQMSGNNGLNSEVCVKSALFILRTPIIK